MTIETIDQFYRKYEELDRLYRHKSPGALYYLFQDVILPLQAENARLKSLRESDQEILKARTAERDRLLVLVKNLQEELRDERVKGYAKYQL